MREKILSELVKEVLGPRDGPEELLYATPLVEYITGVLAPINADVERESEDQNLLGETVASDEDQASDYLTSYPSFSPIVNPQKQPSSFGISFMVKIKDNMVPSISACVTWGTYVSVKEGKRKAWKRNPCCMIVENLDLIKNNNKKTLACNATYTNSADSKVSLQIFTKSAGVNNLLVSIFFCNEELIDRTDEDWKARRIDSYLFQPQIRVKCNKGVEIQPFPDQIKPLYDNKDDRVLNLLYRNIPVMARGHMCAAVWQNIDPEEKSDNEDDERRRPAAPPFTWVDATNLPTKWAEVFKKPHIRTEFVPIHSVAMPDLNWNPDYGIPPVFDASKLSECWNTDVLIASLGPLVTGYDQWLKAQKEGIETLSAELKETAKNNLQKHEIAIDRIKNAIQILKTNDDARLAFCFLNKVMSLQRDWENNRLSESQKSFFNWRPFQIAFILLNIPSIVIPQGNDRKFCDLLWVPTGTGKTEAYIGLAIFTLAYRRKNKSQAESGISYGTTILTRYTLRLLTMQQFRRTLKAITACEFLRIFGLKQGRVGWRPSDCNINDNFLWGTQRFSIGLWVGGEMTPNSLIGTDVYLEKSGVERIPGAIDILRDKHGEGRGEPAQVINCPVCNNILSISDRLEKGNYRLHIVFSSRTEIENFNKVILLDDHIIHIKEVTITCIKSELGRAYHTISMDLKFDSSVNSEKFDNWWNICAATPLKNLLGTEIVLECSKPSRPGYFLKSFKENGKECFYDFEIFCTNPSCDLNAHSWCEENPSGLRESSLLELSRNLWNPVNPAFSDKGTCCVSSRIPIPAYTVDDQVYHRCPSLVVSTVDKFARLPFEPKSSALFGNVSKHHRYYGYYNSMVPPRDCLSISGYPADPLQNPRPSNAGYIVDISPMRPPDLIIQDELHLISGPLGSLVGIYETAIDSLGTNENIHAKYVASTATIRQATEQVQSIFNREVFAFPAPALDVKDSFFLRYRPVHPLNERVPGRLHVGLSAPGKGAQTPIIRLWALLLQYPHFLLENKQAEIEDIDPYWTIVGYFNAIRELAGATALYKQDVIGRLRDLNDRFGKGRILSDYIELSSRISSTALPNYLDILEKKVNRNEGDEIPIAVFTTNIFGVGVDISRLGLMIVHGQPKTTSEYIQATGRIGRRQAGLVVTFYRSTRPRDLSHYEYFAGYHSMLQRYVEPITVYPFAPRVLDRARGPITVALLRCSRQISNFPVSNSWRVEQRLSKGRYYSGAANMKMHRYDPEVNAIAEIFKIRAENQSENRIPNITELLQKVKSGLDDWYNSSITKNEIIYWERRLPSSPQKYFVVLGDSTLPKNSLGCVFKNVPSSLRDIEETIGLEVP